MTPKASSGFGASQWEKEAQRHKCVARCVFLHPSHPHTTQMHARKHAYSYKRSLDLNWLPELISPWLINVLGF